MYGIAKDFFVNGRRPSIGMTEKFLLIWGLTVPIVFQSFATKYVTYTLPYMMPIAIMFARFFVKHEKMFLRMAAVTVIILTVSTFFAISICNDHSGKELSRRLIPNVDEDTRVVMFTRHYSTSLVFYSGLEVTWIERPEKMYRILPQKMTWTSLNVMPMMTTKDLPPNEKIVAVVDSVRSDTFLNAVGGTWIMIDDSVKDYKIYRRISRKDIDLSLKN